MSNQNIAPGTADPNVKIPDAIKAVAARAEAAHKAAYQTEDAPDAEEQVAPAEATFAEQPVQEVTPAGNEPQTKAEDDQSWEHRYKSMKGRYDRADAQIRAMSEQISSLQNVIATMQVAAPTRETQFSDQTAERFITAEEEQDYGSDFLNVVGKKAKEELMPIVKGYEQKIAELETRLKGFGGYVEQDAKSRVEATLDERVPNWRDVNMDPNFISWLKLPDPYSGAIRHELLKAAYQRHDAPRVTAFFNGFLAEEAATDPATGEIGRSKAPAKRSLEEFAAPGRAKTAAATGAPAEKPIITRAEIAKFYADSAAGKFRGRDAEKNRIEAQIFEAERDGRIR